VCRRRNKARGRCRFIGFAEHGERLVAIRARPLFHCGHERQEPSIGRRFVRENCGRGAVAAFVQILGKLDFFDLRENLPIILFDYGQKRLGPANAVFKAAC
jgi:hypothetical protein